MLSRVADNLYWMARYIERAENITRLLEVNLQLLLDFEHLDDDRVKEHWEPIIRATGDEELFYQLYQRADSQTVTDFLTFNPENPNSVANCIAFARENARMVRDQISTELFETLNNLFLFLRSADSKSVWQLGAWDFYERIVEYSHLFQGLVSATASRDEGFDFMQFGTFMERADKTTRILDVKYHMLLPRVSDVGGAVDVAQWIALLKSASGFEAYHRIYVADVNPAKIAEFLIFSINFPRSIRFCVQEINAVLHRISGCPAANYSNEAERLAGMLLSELNFGSVKNVLNNGLHEYLDYIQSRLNDIGASTYNAYMFQAPVDLQEEIQQHQMQQ